MSAMAQIMEQVSSAGERFWRPADFASLPSDAVAQALSRLCRRGELLRLRKGLYYRARTTVLGPSRPGQMAVARVAFRSILHPTGATAASLLGLSTQSPAKAHFATTTRHTPTDLPGLKLVGGRPASRETLTELEGAVLETLRSRAANSELDPDATRRRILDVIMHYGMFPKLSVAGIDEPPRVRAMLGAIGQELEVEPRELSPLRASLNRFSRFDYGKLRTLRWAEEWQAR